MSSDSTLNKSDTSFNPTSISALPASSQETNESAAATSNSASPLAWRSGKRPSFAKFDRHNRTSSDGLNQNFKQQRSVAPRGMSRSIDVTRASIPTIKLPLPLRPESANTPLLHYPTRQRSENSLRSNASSDTHTSSTDATTNDGLAAALKAGTWWREGPMPRHLRDHLEHRHFADLRSLEPGCIIWVPQKDFVDVPLFCIREGHPCRGEELNDTGFDHPAVILGVHRGPGVHGETETYCTVAQMRTFRRTSQSTYTAGAGQQFRESVPIRYPEDGFPQGKLGDDVEQLDLLRGDLFNQTYIQLQHIFKVPATKIMVFHFGSRLATDVKLTDESFVRLMHLFGYTEEMGADGSVPTFGPSPPLSSRMQGYYGSNFPKPKTSYDANNSEWS